MRPARVSAFYKSISRCCHKRGLKLLQRLLLHLSRKRFRWYVINMTEYSFSILLKTLQSITEKAYNAPAIFGTYDTLVRHFKKPIFFGRVPKKSAKEEKI